MKFLYSLMACAILAACSFEADETTRTDNSAASPKESVVMYRNSSYIPVLKEKAAEITTRKQP